VRRAWADWRVKLIVGFVVASTAATGCDYYEGYGLNPATHFGAVFAAWVGGLALFVITGIVVAIVSLAKPEEESFDARARILFRRQVGKHIDYIISRIQEVLEHYAESTDIKVAIIDYDQDEKKYKISNMTDTVVRSYLDDVESTYISEARIGGVTAPPKGGTRNRIIYIRVDCKPVGTSEEFDNEFARPITCRIDRDGTSTVSIRRETWVCANDEDNFYAPRRYTQIVRVQFENLLPSNQNVEVKFTVDGREWIEQLTTGSHKQVLTIKDVKPGTVAFNYRFMAT
jgi:hypothetical protein